jgi:4-hydroxybutyrate---CoA ligase (AMP-forming)
MPWDVEVIIGDIPDTTMVYQLILDSWDMKSLRVKVETSRRLPDPDYEKGVKDTLEKRLGIPVEAEVVSSGAIPTAPGGYKTMKVVDNRPKKG